MPGRAIYIFVGVAAAVPCLVLAGTAPLGNSWVWFEFPRRITMIAACLGLFACFRRSVGWGVLVPFATGALVLAWEYYDESRALAKLGLTESFPGDHDIMFREAFERLATWLVGGLYGALAVMTVLRRGRPQRQYVLAGAWLAVVGAFAAGVTLHVDHWLTLENLSKPGTYTAGGMWCDSRIVSIVVDLAALAGGIVLVAVGLRRPSPIPRAQVIER